MGLHGVAATCTMEEHSGQARIAEVTRTIALLRQMNLLIALRDVLFKANAILETDILDDRQSYLVHVAQALANDGDPQSRTALSRAVLQGYGVQEALARQAWALDEFDCTGLAPAHLAAKKSSIASLKTLLTAGAQVDRKDYIGWTPLVHAAYNNNLDCVKCLLTAGASVKPQANSGFTSLHAAAQFSSPQIVKELLEKGASPATRNGSGRTPLHDFSFSRQSTQVLQEKLRFLMSANADLECRDRYGYTPVLAAIANNNLPALRCLVEAGASLLCVDLYGRNILHHAAATADLAMLHYLKDQDLAGIELSNVRGMHWENFDFVQQQTSWNVMYHRCPSQEEENQFRQLCGEIQNRSLKNMRQLDQRPGWPRGLQG